MKGINICQTCAEAGEDKLVHFFCPVDSFIHAENVNFLCNKCKSFEMIYRNGLYICPQCLNSPDAFECRICGSQDVALIKGEKNND